MNHTENLINYVWVERTACVFYDILSIEYDHVAAGQNLKHVESIDEKQWLKDGRTGDRLKELDVFFTSSLFFLPGWYQFVELTLCLWRIKTKLGADPIVIGVI